MSDLGTQLRDYFDANVERVVPEDIFAGRGVIVQAADRSPRWRASPRLATVLGFAVTVFIIGGSLGLGLVLRRPGDTPGSDGISFEIGAGAPESTGWGLLGAAAILAVIAMVFMAIALRSARRSSRRKGKEKAMATTFDTPSIDHQLDEAHRANRWLIAAVVLLAVALVVLGAWVINDLTATSATEGPAEVRALLDDYTAAWNAYDGEAFLGLVGSTYTHFGDGVNVRDAESTASLIESAKLFGTKIEQIGDPVFVESATGTGYVVSIPNRISTDASLNGAEGISVFRIVYYPASGWKIIDHTYTGYRP